MRSDCHQSGNCVGENCSGWVLKTKFSLVRCLSTDGETALRTLDGAWKFKYSNPAENTRSGKRSSINHLTERMCPIFLKDATSVGTIQFPLQYAEFKGI